MSVDIKTLLMLPRRELTKEEASAIDALAKCHIGSHPITPTFVDSTTGTRYENMDRETIGSILKLNLK